MGIKCLRPFFPSFFPCKAELNAEKLGFSFLAFIEVSLAKTGPDVFDDFKQAAQKVPEIQECHMVAGGFDYLLKIRVTDMPAYRRFLGEVVSRLPGVDRTHTCTVMEEVKSTRSPVI